MKETFIKPRTGETAQEKWHHQKGAALIKLKVCVREVRKQLLSEKEPVTSIITLMHGRVCMQSSHSTMGIQGWLI